MIIPVIIEIYDNPEDELEAIVLNNNGREKTAEQKVREGMILEAIEYKRADKRKKTGVKIDLSDESSLRLGKGKTTDIVAKKVGLNSGRQYERARNVVKKIDELKKEGNIKDAEQKEARNE